MKERNKSKKDTNGVRIGVTIFTLGLIVSLLVVAYISQKNPNTDFITTISGIGTFATALLTALYVYTTTQQISIANNQLAEMKYDRITQEQPLVVVNCEKFKVNPPKMYYSPPENKYSFCSQYYYEAEIKNESSFAAISVDVTSEMLIKTDEGKKVLHTSSERIKTLSAGQQIKIGFLFLDEGKYSVYTALRQMKTNELPVIKTTIIYKNLCGVYFMVNSYSTVFPSKDDMQQLVAWHTSITTAATASKEIIDRMLALPLNDPDRKKMFNTMKESFNSNFENDVALSVDCEEEPLGFEVALISKDEFQEILSEHGYARRIRGFDDCIITEK